MGNSAGQSTILELFGRLDDEWDSVTRSIRIDGNVTSVRLELFYWRILSEIAAEGNLQVPQLLTKLSVAAKSIAAKSGETKHTNFTSFVRVCCGRYLDQQAKAGATIDEQEVIDEAAELQVR